MKTLPKVCAGRLGPARRRACAFTLVELLVVITIIGVLVSLLLPAVQSARESGRMAQCKNHLRNLAMACIQHNTTNTHMPTGGWGWGYVGDPDRGRGVDQCGGWAYNILPFIEQQPLHDAGKGLTGTAKKDALGLMAQSPLSVFYCPSRRQAKAYPYKSYAGGGTAGPASNYSESTVAARLDYAINGGSIVSSPAALGIWSSNCGNADCGPATDPTHDELLVKKQLVTTFGLNGVSYPLSTVKDAMIRDGMSGTYLIAEKSLNPDSYTNGVDSADNENAYIGDNGDIRRNTANPPLRDRAGVASADIFGSAHSPGFHAAFCDGSTRIISFKIDPDTHLRLGNRADSSPIDVGSL
ncbi:MAG: DUF1559 domain-containing protein [Planctomycetales bacterium]|nr:DUF1559 domain-containing protein [Planctomycetales bacterium]